MKPRDTARHSKAILLLFHCDEDAGFAIKSLERVFTQAARRAGFSNSRIFASYPRLSHSPRPRTGIHSRIEFDPNTTPADQRLKLSRFIKLEQVKVVLAFDLSLNNKICGVMRKAGVSKIIAYWGAPMSSLNRFPKLWLKRIEVWLRRDKPDLFLFESESMIRTAVYGRGISSRSVRLVRLGVDTDQFRPDAYPDDYLFNMLNIPKHRKVVFYSGHMEPRKGVDVIISAAIHLIDTIGRRDVHFLLCGNRTNEADRYLARLAGHKAADHVTFGGYRDDIHLVMPGCQLGVIASTGWDSFTMSSIEMQSSGLPLLVSRLQGLVETIEHGKTGYSFPAGDGIALANHIEDLLDDEPRRLSMSANARQRVVEHFNKERQVEKLASYLAI